MIILREKEFAKLARGSKLGTVAREYANLHRIKRDALNKINGVTRQANRGGEFLNNGTKVIEGGNRLDVMKAQRNSTAAVGMRQYARETVKQADNAMGNLSKAWQDASTSGNIFAHHGTGKRGEGAFKRMGRYKRDFVAPAPKSVNKRDLTRFSKVKLDPYNSHVQNYYAA